MGYIDKTDAQGCLSLYHQLQLWKRMKISENVWNDKLYKHL